MIDLYKHTYTYMPIDIYIFIYTHTYIHIYTYTHTVKHIWDKTCHAFISQFYCKLHWAFCSAPNNLNTSKHDAMISKNPFEHLSQDCISETCILTLNLKRPIVSQKELVCINKQQQHKKWYVWILSAVTWCFPLLEELTRLCSFYLEFILFDRLWKQPLWNL